jgi:phospholipase C
MKKWHLCWCLLLTACASSALPLAKSEAHRIHQLTTSPIQHVVIVIQENRTFDNLFNGYPGANTAQKGLRYGYGWVALQPMPLYSPWDLNHSHDGFIAAYRQGEMSGWSLEGNDAGPNKTSDPLYPYHYTQQSDVQEYWAIAKQYVVADRMFSSNNGPSFPAHQMLIAGQEQYNANPGPMPWGCDGVKPECFDYQTLGDELDAAGLSWRYYADGVLGNPKSFSGWQAYDAIRHIRFGPDWSPKHIGSPGDFFTDIADGRLDAVTWVTPSSLSSDHAGGAGDTGPSWVTSIVDAVGGSQYWNNTAILITWDDCGGWYDHVLPPQTYPDGLGFRVPLIVVSPYAVPGYISHKNHEFGSILHYTEEQFNLPSLGTRDSTSDDLSDCFNYGQTPIVFQPFAQRVPLVDLLHEPAGPPDDY